MGFVESVVSNPHPGRQRRLLHAHPEVRTLYGTNPWTAAIAVGLVLAQLALAAVVGLLGVPWWGALLLAWCVGAFLDHALFAVMHEAAHRLVSRRRWLNNGVLMLANVPFVVPFAFEFAHWHLEHHRTQGDRQLDPDLPADWEARWFRGPVGKMAWHVLFPFIQPFRALNHRGGPRLSEPRQLALFAVQAGVFAAVLGLLGPMALLYLLASMYFVYALHPISGRFVQEHHLMPGMGPQQTASYVGPLNALTLNFGLHTQHHDFPGVPWNRLPAVRRLTREEGWLEHRSWTALWLRFLFDPRVGPQSRVIEQGSATSAVPAGSRAALARRS